MAALAPAVRAGLERQLAQKVAPLLGSAHVIATYAATGAEIDPAPLDPMLPLPCFPRVTQESLLRFHAASRDALVRGAHGIGEPPAGAPEVRPAVVLVPLLLFDRRGGRLGQGGGHYDRALTHLRTCGPVRAIGLAWDMQETDPMPLAEWDAPLDLVVTPTRTIACNPRIPDPARPGGS